MSDRRAGLNKQVSEIFDGIKVPETKKHAKSRTAKGRRGRSMLASVTSGASRGGGMDIRRKVTAALVPVLMIVLIAVLMKVLNISTPSSTMARESKPAEQTQTRKPANWKIPSVYPRDLKDPMGRSAEPVAVKDGSGQVSSHSSITVTGIVYSKDKPSAIIAGQIVHENDSIAGANIVKIYPDRVEFSRGGETWSQGVEQ